MLNKRMVWSWLCVVRTDIVLNNNNEATKTYTTENSI